MAKVKDSDIIDYCEFWRSTGEIMDHFWLEYEQAVEICYRLHREGKLHIRLKRNGILRWFEFMDCGKGGRCVDCVNLQRTGLRDFGDKVFECEAQSCAFHDQNIRLEDIRSCD